MAGEEGRQDAEKQEAGASFPVHSSLLEYRRSLEMEEEPMKKNKKLRRVLIIVVVLAVIAAVAVLQLKKKGSTTYTTETARTQDINTYYTFSGNIEPEDAMIVTATQRGTVKELKFEEGDTVSEDDEVVVPKSGIRVKAPMDGTISDIYVEEDDDYVPGDQLFRVADYAHPILKIKVDEYDVSALKKGTTVDVKVHATGETLTGTIVRIAQEATVSGDVAYYEAKISLPQDGTLVMGLTCEISVPRESAENATTVSMDAIQYDDDGKPYVYCYGRSEEIVKQTVILGINNGTIVEIKDGVKSGETILIPKSNALKKLSSVRNK